MTDETNNENLDSNLNSEDLRPHWNSRWPAFVASVLTFTLLSGALLVGVPMYLEHRNAEKAAQELEHARSLSGPITPANTEFVKWDGKQLPNTFDEQKALSEGDSITTPPAYIFRNDAKNADRKIVTLDVDFGQQRSRDLLLVNRTNLESMLTSGQVELRVRPVPTGNSYSLYASEALAESFVVNPSKSWNFMYELIELSASTTPKDKPAELAKKIEEVAKKLGLREIDRTSIRNGTFTGWLTSTMGETDTATVPNVDVNGRVVPDDGSVSINDPKHFRTFVESTS